MRKRAGSIQQACQVVRQRGEGGGLESMQCRATLILSHHQVFLVRGGGGDLLYLLVMCEPLSLTGLENMQVEARCRAAWRQGLACMGCRFLAGHTRLDARADGTEWEGAHDSFGLITCFGRHERLSWRGPRGPRLGLLHVCITAWRWFVALRVLEPSVVSVVKAGRYHE